ncbi:MAG: hypothetical protein Q4E16_05285 [Neisseria sp.]|nr:hypothetical protein [Neisseria sp.]
MSNGKSWADLISGKVQIKEPKKYLREEINEDPTNIFTLFMNGLKNYLEKDIQQDVLHYNILKEEKTRSSFLSFIPGIKEAEENDNLINFTITLPNDDPKQGTVFIFFIRIAHIKAEEDKHSSFGYQGTYNYAIRGIFTIVAPAKPDEAKKYLMDDDKEKLFELLRDQIQMTLPTSETHPDIEFIVKKDIHMSGNYLSSVEKMLPAITKNIEKAGYEKYAQESNWEAIYQYIQETIMKHPALQG